MLHDLDVLGRTVLTSFDWNWTNPVCVVVNSKKCGGGGVQTILGGIAILSMLF